MIVSIRWRQTLLLAAVLLTAGPVLAGYQLAEDDRGFAFEFASRGDTVRHAAPGEVVEFGFSLTNTGTEPDGYEFDCRVIQSVPSWYVIYCVGFLCGTPGVILYDTLAVGEVDTVIHVTIFTDSTQGEEVINLHVRSQGNPSLADSITTRTLVGSGIEDPPGAGVLAAPALRVAPNPASGPATVSFLTDGAAWCQLILHDVTGSQVETLLDGRVGPGRQELRWCVPPRLAAGVYLLRLTAGLAASACQVIIE